MRHFLLIHFCAVSAVITITIYFIHPSRKLKNYKVHGPSAKCGTLL